MKTNKLILGGVLTLLISAPVSPALSDVVMGDTNSLQGHAVHLPATGMSGGATVMNVDNDLREIDAMSMDSHLHDIEGADYHHDQMGGTMVSTSRGIAAEGHVGGSVTVAPAGRRVSIDDHGHAVQYNHSPSYHHGGGMGMH